MIQATWCCYFFYKKDNHQGSGTAFMQIEPIETMKFFYCTPVFKLACFSYTVENLLVQGATEKELLTFPNLQSLIKYQKPKILKVVVNIYFIIWIFSIKPITHIISLSVFISCLLFCMLLRKCRVVEKNKHIYPPILLQHLRNAATTPSHLHDQERTDYVTL